MKPGLPCGHALEDELGFFVDVVIIIRGTATERAGNDSCQVGDPAGLTFLNMLLEQVDIEAANGRRGHQLTSPGVTRSSSAISGEKSSCAVFQRISRSMSK